MQAVHELAGRWHRLGAAIIDSIVVAILVLVVLGIFGQTDSLVDQDFTSQARNAIIGAFVWIGAQFYFLREGQTMGKRLLRIRMVDYTTGEVPSMVQLIAVRFLPVQLINLIPGIGPLLALVDVLFIFGSERRCLHDLLAGTKVVTADAMGYVTQGTDQWSQPPGASPSWGPGQNPGYAPSSMPPAAAGPNNPYTYGTTGYSGGSPSGFSTYGATAAGPTGKPTYGAGAAGAAGASSYGAPGAGASPGASSYGAPQSAQYGYGTSGPIPGPSVPGQPIPGQPIPGQPIPGQPHAGQSSAGQPAFGAPSGYRGAQPGGSHQVPYGASAANIPQPGYGAVGFAGSSASVPQPGFPGASSGQMPQAGFGGVPAPPGAHPSAQTGPRPGQPAPDPGVQQRYGMSSPNVPRPGFGAASSAQMPQPGFGAASSAQMPQPGFGAASSAQMPQPGFGGAPGQPHANASSANVPQLGYGGSSANMPRPYPGAPPVPARSAPGAVVPLPGGFGSASGASVPGAAVPPSGFGASPAGAPQAARGSEFGARGKGGGAAPTAQMMNRAASLTDEATEGPIDVWGPRQPEQASSSAIPQIPAAPATPGANHGPASVPSPFKSPFMSGPPAAASSRPAPAGPFDPHASRGAAGGTPMGGSPSGSPRPARSMGYGAGFEQAPTQPTPVATGTLESDTEPPSGPQAPYPRPLPGGGPVGANAPDSSLRPPPHHAAHDLVGPSAPAQPARPDLRSPPPANPIPNPMTNRGLQPNLPHPGTAPGASAPRPGPYPLGAPGRPPGVGQDQTVPDLPTRPQRPTRSPFDLPDPDDKGS